MILRKAAGPLLLAVVAAGACDSRVNPIIGIVTDTTVVGGGGTTPPSLATVLIVDNEFQPSLSILRSGGIVVWTWATGASEHNVTFADAALNSPTQTGGSTYTLTFATVGTFDYHCTIHPAMSGSIVVR